MLFFVGGFGEQGLVAVGAEVVLVEVETLYVENHDLTAVGAGVFDGAFAVVEGDGEAAERLYDEIIKMPVYKKDFAFASEYMGWLNSDGKYEKAWEIYEGCPEEYRQVDRMILHAMLCAMRLGKLGFLKPLFAREYAVIREGENSLTDIWFEYNARLKAENYDKLSEDEKTRLLSEAEENCPPPDETDFRMSYNKKFKYRKTE